MVYGRIESSSEIVDVLYAISMGAKTPQDISKKVGQSGTVVRSKLMFLRKTGVVRKVKWNYAINENVACEKILSSVKSVLKEYEKVSGKDGAKLRKVIRNADFYFTRPLLLGLLKVYALAFFKGYQKLSFREMSQMFLGSLPSSSDRQLLKMDKRLLEVKKILTGIPTREKFVISHLTK